MSRGGKRAEVRLLRPNGLGSPVRYRDPVRAATFRAPERNERVETCFLRDKQIWRLDLGASPIAATYEGTVPLNDPNEWVTDSGIRDEAVDP